MKDNYQKSLFTLSVNDKDAFRLQVKSKTVTQLTLNACFIALELIKKLSTMYTAVIL